MAVRSADVDGDTRLLKSEGAVPFQRDDRTTTVLGGYESTIRRLRRRSFSNQEERASTASTRTWRQRRHQNGVDEDAASKGHRHTAEWAPVRWSIHRRKTSWRRRRRGNELPAATIRMRSSSSSPVICCGRRRRCGIQLPATTDEDASTTSSRVPSIRARRSSSSSSQSSVEGDNDFFGVLGDKVNPDVHGSEVFLDSNAVNKRIN